MKEAEQLSRGGQAETHFSLFTSALLMHLHEGWELDSHCLTIPPGEERQPQDLLPSHLGLPYILVLSIFSSLRKKTFFCLHSLLPVPSLPKSRDTNLVFLTSEPFLNMVEDVWLQEDKYFHLSEGGK